MDHVMFIKIVIYKLYYSTACRTFMDKSLPLLKIIFPTSAV